MVHLLLNQQRTMITNIEVEQKKLIIGKRKREEGTQGKKMNKRKKKKHIFEQTLTIS